MSGNTFGRSEDRNVAETDFTPPGLELVDSKLRAPQSRPGSVVRKTLVDRLEISRAPVVTIVAPAGYGKTTLLRQWSDHHPTQVTWLSLDRHDDDPGVLIGYLVAALERIEPVDRRRRGTLLGEAAVDISGSVRRVAAWVSSIRTQFLMIIDQTDAIQTKVSSDLIAAVALNLPAGSRLALASRTEPPIPMARLRAEGHVEEISQTDLTMGDDEAAQLLAHAGVTLSAADVSTVVGHTEGWPVGLYLASLAITSSGSRSGALALPDGDDRVVADYLHAEVMSSLSPPTASLLMRTSILDRLCGPLCDAVTASSGSQELLESFEKSSLLIVPLDRTRHWYRCHHLLAQMLRAELERTEPEVVSRLHDRASTWFETNGDLSAALDHAQLAGDGDRAALLFCRIGPTFQAAGRTDTVSRWLRWFEERNLIGHYPQMAALGAILEALNGERAYSLLLADSAAAGDMDSPVPDGGRLGGWVAAMEACLCRRGVDRMRDDAGRAVDLLSMGSPLRGPVIALEGVAALIQGDPAAADQLFVVSAELCLRSRNAPSHALSLAERAVIAIDRGDHSGARILSEQAVNVVEEMHIEAYVDAVLVYAVAGRLAAQAGELNDAHRYIAASARLRPRCTAAIPWSAQFLVQLAQGYVALGDGLGARAVLRQVRDILLVTPDLGVLAEKCVELNQLLDSITVGSGGASSLTAAELRLLPLLATHLTHQEIGERLYVSRNTIKSQAMSVYRKLGVSSRGEAVRTAEQIGLLGS